MSQFKIKHYLLFCVLVLSFGCRSIKPNQNNDSNITVHLYGAVEVEGDILLSRGDPFITLLRKSGLKYNALRNNIIVVRGRGDLLLIYPIRVRDEPNIVHDFILQDGDRIYVPGERF